MEAQKSYFVLLVEHVWSDYLCTNVLGEFLEWMRKAEEGTALGGLIKETWNVPHPLACLKSLPQRDGK
jgi:hypothetical protein